MINPKLLNPKSIAVIGASNDIHKPGGSLLKNLLKSPFKGDIYVVNPKEESVQGIKCYANVAELPKTDCAILAIAARYCPETVNTLAYQKETGGFVIISAGFGEESNEGAQFEKEIVETIDKTGGSLIGPNCTGFLNVNYCGAFDAPIPPLDRNGIDFISGSGAVAVYIKEVGLLNGLSFNSIWAVGNSAQIGIEEVIEHLDETFDPVNSSKIILLYMEIVYNPQKLLKHATSLINKGCRIAGLKAGSSDAGSRAASSHTGALATSDVAVDALFRKAGIVRCYNREELLSVASIFTYPEVKGKNIGVITHAGGPAVMLTDVLSNNGLNVPHLEGEAADELLTKLFPGSAVGNPVDFLATGTAEQLGTIIDYCNDKFDNLDAMCVIFGSPGLFPNWEPYKVLDEKIKNSKKPLFPILPSLINAKEEIEDFIHQKHHVNFPDECTFGYALAKVINTPKPQPLDPEVPEIDTDAIRAIIDRCENGYISLEYISGLLDAAGIGRKKEVETTNVDDVIAYARAEGYPLVMKVVGPVHKSDVGGVVLNIMDEETIRKEFDRLMNIKDTYAVEVYKMLFGTELFIGASREEKFGHQILFGLGGIFIEVLKDVKAALAPVSVEEATSLIKTLRGYKILQGVRGQEPVDEYLFADTIARVSALVTTAPEIAEMDLNPLLGTSNSLIAVDARIRVERDL